MDHARTYRLTWTRDPRRESAALLVALRGRLLVAFLLLALVCAILTALAQAYLWTIVIIVVAAFIPFSIRGRLRRSLSATDPNVRMTLSDSGVRPGKDAAIPWDTFTHWRLMPHDIVLLQRTGRRAKGALLIPLDAVPQRDREGVFALLDQHLTRQN